MYNYSKRFLESMALQTGFIRDNLEKTFRLCDILQFLNTDPITKECLSLKGGTAINLVIFNMPRLSVDIDLDFSINCSREKMLDLRVVINEEILNFMFAHGYALSPNTKNPHSLDSWVFYFQNAGGNRDNIKIEINYSMRSHILPIVKKKAMVEFLCIENEISTLSTPELFGTKTKALIERTAPRDLYDVYNMIIHNIISPEEQDLFRKIVLFYLVIGTKDSIPSHFNFENIKALKYSKIKSNLTPVLKKGEHFEFETAKTTVTEYLSKLMAFTDKENLFIEHFNQGIYQPDLLFDDADIMNRIKEHPMALWRTKYKIK